jgi:tRNA(Ile)-lysidine synthase
LTRPAELLTALRRLSFEDGCPRPGEALVVGLSGGADSVALVDLLHCWAQEGSEDSPAPIVAVHVDHGLREESNEDARFCAEFCRERHIDFVSEVVDVKALAAETGLGIEAAGRRARYDIFERVRQERGGDRVATAHHLDDHLETIFLWMGRGSGLSALVGIEASTDERVRPLRSFRSEELREYLRSRKLDWREDPTNVDATRRRNRVGSELLPCFEEIFGPGAAERLGRLSLRAGQERRALRQAAFHLLTACQRPGPEGTICLSRRDFMALSPELQTQVLRAVAAESSRPDRSQRWNEDHFRRVLRFMEGARAGQDASLPEGGLLGVDRDLFTFWTGPRPGAQEGDAEVGHWALREELLPASAERVTFLQHDGADLGGSTTIFHADFDADCIRGPLRLRSLRDGDRMQPLGMSGHKKIRRLLAEHAVPRHRRESQLVVEDSRRVIWVVGLATSHDARVQTSTRSVLRLRVEPGLPIARQQGKDSGS